MILLRFGRRLFHNDDGQYLLFGAVLVLAILGFLLVIPNGTQVGIQKVRAQTAADAGAFTGSIWLARTLNLSSNMNVGIRSVYTWMTVLTVGEALAQALYSDTLDPSVKTMGQNITLALFNSSNPVTVNTSQYPSAIRKLDTTARWLSSLQDDIGASFSQVAATQGTSEACLDINGSTSSQTAGGWALVHTNDTIPLLRTTTKGDSLMYAGLSPLVPALQTLPTNDSNIGPAYGLVKISPTTWDVWAYYSDTSLWMTRVDSFYHCYKKCVIQTWYNTSNKAYDTMIEYRDKPGNWQNPYMKGDSLGHWLYMCNEPGHDHTPIVQIGVGQYAPPWQFVEGHPSNNRYKMDTCWTRVHMAKRKDTSGMHAWSHAESLWVQSSGDDSVTERWIPTGFYTGAESTVPIKGTRVEPRQVNPGREFHTVSYVWKNGATSSPYGLGPPMGGTIFPRARVAATSPLLTVARAVPFVAAGTTDSFFNPAWDAKLTRLDSIGVHDMTSDTAFSGHSRNCFNLDYERKYALLP